MSSRPLAPRGGAATKVVPGSVAGRTDVAWPGAAAALAASTGTATAHAAATVTTAGRMQTARDILIPDSLVYRSPHPGHRASSPHDGHSHANVPHPDHQRLEHKQKILPGFTCSLPICTQTRPSAGPGH